MPSKAFDSRKPDVVHHEWLVLPHNQEKVVLIDYGEGRLELGLKRLGTMLPAASGQSRLWSGGDRDGGFWYGEAEAVVAITPEGEDEVEEDALDRALSLAETLWRERSGFRKVWVCEGSNDNETWAEITREVFESPDGETWEVPLPNVRGSGYRHMRWRSLAVAEGFPGPWHKHAPPAAQQSE